MKKNRSGEILWLGYLKQPRPGRLFSSRKPECFVLAMILKQCRSLNSVQTPHSAMVTHSHVHSRHMGVCVICCHGIDFLFYLAATDLCVGVCSCVCLITSRRPCCTLSAGNSTLGFKGGRGLGLRATVGRRRNQTSFCSPLMGQNSVSPSPPVPPRPQPRLMRWLLGDSRQPGTVTDKVCLPASQWEVLLLKRQ